MIRRVWAACVNFAGGLWMLCRLIGYLGWILIVGDKRDSRQPKEPRW